MKRQRNARTLTRGVRLPIAERIRAAMAGRTSASYFDILRATFPSDQYPRATNYATGGGPPGACMAFGAAVRRMGGSCYHRANGERVVYLPNVRGHRFRTRHG
jgi:hypothetical protein